MDTGLFDYDKAANSAGWIRELQGEHTPETEEYGISSFTYRTSMPFDAEKLWDFLHDDKNWQGVLRSKGFFWVAADHRIASRMGPSRRCQQRQPCRDVVGCGTA